MISFQPGRMLLVGASRGLGLALWRRCAADGWQVTAVARGPVQAAPAGEFLRLDLASPGDVQTLCHRCETEHFDCIVYVAGVWEQEAFAQTPADTLRQLVDTNLVAPLLLGQALLRAPQRTGRMARRHFILIGSTAGLDNEGSASAGYVSTKFGLRGLAHAMREAARGCALYVTCLSVGALATADDAADTDVPRVPADDVYRLLLTIVSLSDRALVKEVVLPAWADGDV